MEALCTFKCLSLDGPGSSCSDFWGPETMGYCGVEQGAPPEEDAEAGGGFLSALSLFQTTAAAEPLPRPTNSVSLLRRASPHLCPKIAPSEAALRPVDAVPVALCCGSAAGTLGRSPGRHHRQYTYSLSPMCAPDHFCNRVLACREVETKRRPSTAAPWWRASGPPPPPLCFAGAPPCREPPPRSAGRFRR